MKKLLSVLLAIVLAFALAACQSGGNGNDVFDGSLAEMIEAMYEVKDPGIAVGDVEIDLEDSDAVKAFTGLDDASGITEIAVSESMIGSQAYSLVLVRVADSKDAKAVAEAMAAGIDPWKWICVGADDLQVVGQGDVVMLFMVSTSLSDAVTSQEMVDAFQSLRGGNLDIAL